MTAPRSDDLATIFNRVDDLLAKLVQTHIELPDCLAQLSDEHRELFNVILERRRIRVEALQHSTERVLQVGELDDEVAVALDEGHQTSVSDEQQ